MACKEGPFDVVKLMANDHFKTFSINLNAQHVNGMTPFDLCTVIRYSRVGRIFKDSSGYLKIPPIKLDIGIDRHLCSQKSLIFYGCRCET